MPLFPTARRPARSVDPQSSGFTRGQPPPHQPPPFPGSSHQRMTTVPGHFASPPRSHQICPESGFPSQSTVPAELLQEPHSQQVSLETNPNRSRFSLFPWNPPRVGPFPAQTLHKLRPIFATNPKHRNRQKTGTNRPDILCFIAPELQDGPGRAGGFPLATPFTELPDFLG